ncbi:MAG: DUF480 domain-containing protein [Planctomycetota bacterium]
MSDTLELDPLEARVLGVLIEKELTTPEQYPLTLHALTAGANQKSNRDPVMEIMEGDAYAAVTKLIRKSLAGAVHPVGGRVEKFRHNAGTGLKQGVPQIAILAELLMRGPQQPGELRARASRMTPLDSLPALMDAMKALIDAGLVKRVDPSPGSRAERYAQTLAPTAHPLETRSPGQAAADTRTVVATIERVESAAKEALEKRIVELEFSVSRLRRQLDNLAWKLGEKLEG